MSSPHRNLAVLGAGNWGTVIALLAARVAEEQHFRVFLYDIDEDKIKSIREHRENKFNLPGVPLPNLIEITSSLTEIFKHCGTVIPVVPAKFMRDFSQRYAAHVRGNHFIVHGSKGFEPISHKRMSQVIYEETGCIRIGALSGPNLASELSRGLPSATVVASPFQEVQLRVKELLTSSVFRVVGSHDLAGVELIGALKNILALASGLCAGLNMGQNATGMMLTEGLEEIRKILQTLGANTETVFGLAGFGDILATSTSGDSRNFKAGLKMAAGKTIEQIETEMTSTVEGFNTLRAAREMSAHKGLEVPFIETLWSVAQQKTAPRSFFDLQRLMLRNH